MSTADATWWTETKEHWPDNYWDEEPAQSAPEPPQAPQPVTPDPASTQPLAKSKPRTPAKLPRVIKQPAITQTTSTKTSRQSASQQLGGLALTVEACKLAWKDQSGGKFTQAFTRRVLQLSPVFVADDALIPLTMGASTPVSWGTNVILAIGAIIYGSKVSKYRKRLSGKR